MTTEFCLLCEGSLIRWGGEWRRGKTLWVCSESGTCYHEGMRPIYRLVHKSLDPIIQGYVDVDGVVHQAGRIEDTDGKITVDFHNGEWKDSPDETWIHTSHLLAVPGEGQVVRIVSGGSLLKTDFRYRVSRIEWVLHEKKCDLIESRDDEVDVLIVVEEA